MNQHTPRSEAGAIAEIDSVLSEIMKEDEEAGLRVLEWANMKFRRKGSLSKAYTSTVKASPVFGEINDLPSLFSAASPKVEAEKVLVAAYWFQVHEEYDELESQMLNTELKQLGHGIKNVTRALGNLLKQKPQLVLQTKKSGKAKQARKKYRLTQAGINAVQRMISPSPEENENE